MQPESSSGASCPGLIEARTIRGTFSPGWRCHPGLLAPASLKHPQSWWCSGASPLSSGASCPGLIEVPAGLFAPR